MSQVNQEEIDEALERAETIKEQAEEYIGVAGRINNETEMRLQEKRDANYIPLDDIPYGEEVLRVESELTNVDAAISTLEKLSNGEIPADEIAEAFHEAIVDLENAEDTLEDVGAEETLKAENGSDEYDEDDEFDENEDDDNY